MVLRLLVSRKMSAQALRGCFSALWTLALAVKPDSACHGIGLPWTLTSTYLLSCTGLMRTRPLAKLQRQTHKISQPWGQAQPRYHMFPSSVTFGDADTPQYAAADCQSQLSDEASCYLMMMCDICRSSPHTMRTSVRILILLKWQGRIKPRRSP